MQRDDHGWLYREGQLLEAAERADGSDDGLIRFVASTEAPASDGHIIVQSGWELASYRRNPIFLWAHNGPGICGGRGGAPMHPIGRSDQAEIVEVPRADGAESRLEIAVRFDEGLDPKTNHPINPIAYLTAHQYRARFLNMVSVGFRMLEKKARAEYPKEHVFHHDRGLVSLRTHLGEVSAVPIGADAGAFASGRQGTGLEEAARHFLETVEGRAILDSYVREAILRAEEQASREGRGLFGLARRS